MESTNTTSDTVIRATTGDGTFYRSTTSKYAVVLPRPIRSSEGVSLREGVILQPTRVTASCNESTDNGKPQAYKAIGLQYTKSMH
jgi:hypothetical protein